MSGTQLLFNFMGKDKLSIASEKFDIMERTALASKKRYQLLRSTLCHSRGPSIVPNDAVPLTAATRYHEAGSYRKRKKT
jgi:hypothetical protein